MKKLSYLIVLTLILGLVLTGCLLSNLGQVPTTEQSGITYLTKNPSSSGLVGLWHFDEETGETTVVDSSEYGNNGTVYGATTGVSGKFGNALLFDGEDDYVEVLDKPSLDITEDLTIEAWVKCDSFTYPHSFFVGKDTVNERSYGLWIDGGYYSGKSGRVGFIVFKSPSTYTIHWGNSTLSAGQWYHIAGIYDYVSNGPSIMQIFVNGVLDSQQNTNAVGPIYAGTANLQIGAREYPPDFWRSFVNGLIDEVRIWNVALPQDQLGKVYEFDGFFRPVENLPTLNAAKAGRAIPVKFSLDGDHGLDIFAVGYPKSIQIECGNEDPVGDITDGYTVTAGDSSISYDTSTDQYIYVWKTDKSWAYDTSPCRQLVVKLNDGKSYYANFKFK